MTSRALSVVRRPLLAVCVLTLFAVPAAAQQDPLLPLRVARAPVIDGVLDDSAWEEAPKIAGFKTWLPDYGKEMGDGTVVWYDITKREGRGTHQEMHVSDIERLIREAGRTPVERDTLYRPVRRSPELAGAIS